MKSEAEYKSELEAQFQNNRNGRDFFRSLFDKLSYTAQQNDIGYYVNLCAGAFVNNFREGRDLTIKERVGYLYRKMNESRGYLITLAKLFPADWGIIQEYTREYTTE